MKTAIDCYARGKQKEANADEYSRMYSYSQGRFVCPECGELVHLTGSKYSNHFAHYKKTDVSAQCDRRVDGVPTQSVYERIGLPLYLRKDANDDFRLYMGFRALPNRVLEQAEKNKLSLKIIGTEQKYQISRERFAESETTLIPILHVPFGQAKYHLSYEPQSCSANILSYWSNEADGFSYEGALFSVSSLGGKKIRHGDTISTEVEYYWVRRQLNLPSYISGIDMRKEGCLILKDTKYTVFKGTFTSSMDDHTFSRLTTFLRESLKVHLLEKQPDFIPVWPPCLKTEDGYMTRLNTRWMYGRVESGNDEPKMYVYRGITAIPEECNIREDVAKVLLFSTDTYISIDRKYVSGGVSIFKNNYEISGKEISLECNQEKLLRGFQKIFLESSGNNISIKLPFIFNYILIKKNGETIYKKGVNNIIIDNVCSQDYLLISSNCTTYFAFLFEGKEEKENNDFFEIEMLLSVIHRYGNTKKIKIPHQYKIKLQKYKKEVEIEELLRKDEIPVPALKLLEGL